MLKKKKCLFFLTLSHLLNNEASASAPVPVFFFFLFMLSVHLSYRCVDLYNGKQEKQIVNFCVFYYKKPKIKIYINK